MLETLRKYPLLVGLTVFCWLAVLFIEELMSYREYFTQQVVYTPPAIVRRLIMTFFFVCTAVLMRRMVRHYKKLGLQTILTRVLIVGVVGLCISELADIIAANSGNWHSGFFLKGFARGVSTFWLTIYLLYSWAVFRRLSLYKPDSFKYKLWSFNDYLFIAILLLLIPLPDDLPLGLNYFLPLPLLILTFVIAVKLDWIGYLKVKEKIIALLSFVGIIVLTVAFAWMSESDMFEGDEGFLSRFSKYNRLELLTLFILEYSFIVLLLITFNLPASSIFNQRFYELGAIHRVNQAVKLGESREGIFNAVLDAGLLCTQAEVGWIEQMVDNEVVLLNKKDIDDELIQKIKSADDFTKNALLQKQIIYIQRLKEHPVLRSLQLELRSMVVIPLHSTSKDLGVMYLLKSFSDGFDDDMLPILRTLAEQGAIGIENTSLLSQSIEFERFQEQMRIAHEMQERLLATRQVFEIANADTAVIYKVAYEVGGDYYENQKLNPTKNRILIADVSGKGAEAAFYMAELKGVTQTLALINPEPTIFVNYLNKALSNCLPFGTFITLNYLEIDSGIFTYRFIRAGHSPLLYYNSREKTIDYLRPKGMGLGILRNDQFASSFQLIENQYNPEDIFVLFTDGIIEARNPQGDLFGYERLRDALFSNIHYNASIIAKNIHQSVLIFCGERGLDDDDNTLIIIKFN